MSVDEEVEPDGLEESDEDGVLLLEPAPAEPLMPELDEEGVLLEAPPLAWSFLLMSTDVELPGVVDGVAVLPAADEDDEPEGEVDGEAVEPAGAVVVDELEAPEGARSLA